jgi:hypothetical protein
MGQHHSTSARAPPAGVRRNLNARAFGHTKGLHLQQSDALQAGSDELPSAERSEELLQEAAASQRLLNRHGVARQDSWQCYEARTYHNNLLEQELAAGLRRAVEQLSWGDLPPDQQLGLREEFKVPAGVLDEEIKATFSCLDRCAGRRGAPSSQLGAAALACRLVAAPPMHPAVC